MTDDFTPLVQADEARRDELDIQAETSASAAAAQAQANVQARYLVALKRPRDLDDVRVRLMREAKRPAFAEMAEYKKPIGRGKFIKGPSVRFAESAARCLTNVMVSSEAIFDDRKRRIVRVMVTDLEANVTSYKDVTVAKTVERKNPTGREVLGTRTNSYGDEVFVVVCTDDELLTKENAMISKAKRNAILDILPGDIREDALAQARQTLLDGIKDDPDAWMKRVVDNFAALNVDPEDLKDYLGCQVSKASPSQIENLRSIWAAINSGETTWKQVAYSGPEEEEEEEKPKDKAKATLDDPKAKADAAKAFGDPKGDAPKAHAPGADAPKTYKWTGAHQELKDLLAAQGLDTHEDQVAKINSMIDKKVGGWEELNAADCKLIKEGYLAVLAREEEKKQENATQAQSTGDPVEDLKAYVKDARDYSPQQIKTLLEARLGRPLGSWDDVAGSEAQEYLDHLKAEDAK